jgi:tetrahydromethanopterin S-methyltransferase subunit B
MSEDKIVQQLKELNEKVEKIAKAVNELPAIIDGKLKVLNQNQGHIIRLLEEAKGKSIAHSMETRL